MKMHTPDLVDEHIAKIAEVFPNAVTETIKDGKTVRAIDFDILRQELSDVEVEGNQERYQFTWPDKRKSILLANAPIAKTLRPCKEKSINFDNTENIYIEGDNLDALKLLQETYLGKVKMVYIDPPYNTGSDFVYADNFVENTDEYLANSGQYDEDGNRLVQNNESNGRFHTDWLNMIYPRLKIAKDLLSDDGAIFISIDDNEVENLKKVCNEIFGIQNFVSQLVWEKKKKGAFLSKKYINMKEYILVYSKKNEAFLGLVGEINSSSETYPCIKTTNARGVRLIRKGTLSKYKEATYQIKAGTRVSSGNMELIYLNDVIVKNNVLQNDIRVDSNWIYSQATLDAYASEGLLYITQDQYIRRIVNEDRTKMLKDLLTRVGSDGKSYSAFSYDQNLNNGGWGTNEDANDELHQLLGQQYLFDFSKPSRLIAKLVQSINDKDCLILDFFSGSATTAHAVMQLNAKDGGHRRFIMVQLPETCDEKSEAFKAGYKNICEIGEERISRAGKKIKEDSPMTTKDLDTGFRVFKVDSTNMKDVYYNSTQYQQNQLEMFADNIKEDRTSEDLLVQVMLDLGILLSSKIEVKAINERTVFSVADGYLIACFEDNITGDTIKEIAKQKPYYAVFRDSGIANDNVATNFEQIFKAYSPTTVKKVL